ncbi:DNA primase [Pseudoroseicyclus tamaricis]|uniref:DNA primase n=1 Tax=Pseudoroseicyclus tamaricis TaxID=2705421 RepID=A0A6B2JNH9_9RHOB|nr:DNA primase [Pseudoroseicyclus tamaricis]NDU99587.1 DNA primase [Pseudoroseicyclus tamaricis]
MSLPPTFLDDLKTRLSLGQVVGRKVIWDRKKSNPAKGDLWAPCPFHQEKTASFHVDDRKGFYYCFGCHAKGDAVSFVRETENMGFMEAIELLAREAGMEMPARDPRAAEKADERAKLTDVMEAALKFYRLQLKTGAAAEARDYLAGRGLTPAAIDRWEIAFAPNDRTALSRHLQGQGISTAQADEAGLVIVPDDGGAPYDRFRGRILFPIRDGRGRLIAFGGRAMDPNARAKYLNSPETPLFDKGRSLFNHQRAREAAGKGHPLVVAEGYMDVIALAEAGFEAAVAPLGTAVTADQLQLLWRISDEPVIALDGDAAGQRAALRVIDLALPLLEAGKSLRVALMPEGQDPDDLIRAKGREAMSDVIEGARPLIDLLWQRETEGRVLDSPERRAALDKRLREVIGTIKDRSLRRHYGEEIGRLRREAFGGGGGGGGGDRREGRREWQPRGEWRGKGRDGRGVFLPAVRAESRATIMVEGGEDRMQEAAILGILAATPAVLPEFLSELEMFDCRHPPHEALRQALIRAAEAKEPGVALEAEVGAQALENLRSDRHLAVIPAIRRAGDAALARLSVAEGLAGLKARRGHEAALAEAMEDIGEVEDEWLTRRLEEAAAALDPTRRLEAGDKRATLTAPNGLAVDREESAALDALIGQLGQMKPPKGRQR